jgi:hypothetical protein
MFGACLILYLGLWLTELELLEQGVEALVVGFPDAAVLFEPLRSICEGLSFEAARAALGVAAARDEAGALEDFEVLGDGGLGHLERLDQLVDGGIAGGEACEDGAASGIGEGGESGVESIGRGHCITFGLYNHLVIY